MTTKLTRATWEQWGSSYGLSGPDLPGNQRRHQSVNMQVYTNGNLGPRPYFKIITASGLASPIPNNSDTPTFFTSSVTREAAGGQENDVLFIGYGSGNAVTYRVSDDQEVDHATTLYSAGTKWRNPPVYDISYGPQWLHSVSTSRNAILVGGQNILSYYDGALTNELLGSLGNVSAQKPDIGTRHKERLYLAGSQDGETATQPTYRTLFSEPSDFMNFPSANFYDDVGAPEDQRATIVGMWSLTNALILAVNDGTWWALSGASPAQGTLRKIGVGPVPYSSTAPVVFKNAVWFLSPNALDGISVVTPSRIDTGTFKDLAATSDGVPDLNSVVNVLPGLSSDSREYLLFPYTRKFLGDTTEHLEFINGAFNYHKPFQSYSFDREPVYALGQDYIYAALRFGGKWYLYRRYLTLDQPDTGEESLAGESSTNRAKGEVTLSSVRSSVGVFVRPKSLTMEIEYWKGQDFYGASYRDPAITAEVQMDGNSFGDQDSFTTTEVVSTTSWASGERVRKTVHFNIKDARWCSSVIVTLSGIESLALRTVSLEYEIDPSNPK